MAPVTPGTLFAGYQLLDNAEAAPSQGIFIPLASMPDLSAVEAAEVGGDGRKVAFAVVKEVFDNYVALADAAKPAKMSIGRTTPTGLNANTVRQGYTLNFDLDLSSADVSAEA